MPAARLFRFFHRDRGQVNPLIGAGKPFNPRTQPVEIILIPQEYPWRILMNDILHPVADFFPFGRIEDLAQAFLILDKFRVIPRSQIGVEIGAQHTQIELGIERGTESMKVQGREGFLPSPRQEDRPFQGIDFYL